jgi:nucleoside-diphosphate-sugar epimerase
MARVLITGIQGFTGPYVARAVESAGHEACGTEPWPNFDLSRPASLAAAIESARPDYVVHLAGLSSVTHADAAELYAANAVGTGNLLQAIADTAPGVRKVLLASSANVYGNCDAYPIDEQTPPAPVNHYGCSKLSMEFIARAWFDRLPIVITRPFNYTGPGQTEAFLIPKLVAHYAERRPALELGNIEVERDFSDVRMLADAYVKLLIAGDAGIVVNVCSGVGRSVRSVMAELKAMTGHEPQLRVAPHLVRRVEVHRLIGSNSTLRRIIGTCVHTDFSETLRWMVEDRRRPSVAQPAATSRPRA